MKIGHRNFGSSISLNWILFEFYDVLIIYCIALYLLIWLLLCLLMSSSDFWVRATGDSECEFSCVNEDCK